MVVHATPEYQGSVRSADRGDEVYVVYLDRVMARSSSTVMVIDDDADCREILGDALALFGYGVVTAIDGREGLRALERDPKPALILLDGRMPVMDGWQFLVERNRRPWLTQIPVAFLSGDPDLYKRARGLGVARSIPKPIGLEELLSAVERLIGRPR